MHENIKVILKKTIQYQNVYVWKTSLNTIYNCLTSSFFIREKIVVAIKVLQLYTTKYMYILKL